MKLEQLIRDLKNENALLHQSEVERQQDEHRKYEMEIEKQETELDKLKQVIEQKDVETLELTNNLDRAESIHTEYVEKMKQHFQDEIAKVNQESQQLKKLLEETAREHDAARDHGKKQERQVGELEKQYKALKLQYIQYTKDESSDDDELDSCNNNFGHTTAKRLSSRYHKLKNLMVIGKVLYPNLIVYSRVLPF